MAALLFDASLAMRSSTPRSPRPALLDCLVPRGALDPMQALQRPASAESPPLQGKGCVRMVLKCRWLTFNRF
jgi:hypothetical protein